jgi:hypothetical protein
MASIEMQPAVAEDHTMGFSNPATTQRYDTSGPRLALVLGSLWLGGLFVALGEPYSTHCRTGHAFLPQPESSPFPDPKELTHEPLLPQTRP